jgi:UDP-glucose 4-epimerase
MTTQPARADLRGRRVLVTGSKGFIGGHLVPLLASLGAEVTTADLTDDSRPGAVHVCLDLTDPERCSQCVAAARPEIVYHLAATRERTRELGRLRDVLDTNLLATLNLLMAAAELPALQTVVLLGSSEEYGSSQAAFREDMREGPVSAYSFSKVCSTYLAQYLHRVHGLPCVVLRPGLVYGPGQDQGMFLPALIRSVAAGRPFLMTPGQQTRDFIHVSDVVEAIARASACTDGQVLNVGSGVATPIADVAMTVGRLLGRQHLVRVGALEYRTAEVMDHRLDTSLARRVLDWAPLVPLERGLEMTIAAYSEDVAS